MDKEVEEGDLQLGLSSHFTTKRNHEHPISPVVRQVASAVSVSSIGCVLGMTIAFSSVVLDAWKLEGDVDLTEDQISWFASVVQLVSIPGSLLGGGLAQLLGPRRLLFCLLPPLALSWPVFLLLRQYPTILIALRALQPSVSVGNVGQLAVDLLISTMPSQKIGIVHHPAIYPLVGGDPYNSSSKDVVTSADLHLVQQQNLVIMQIRSPLIKNERQNFLTEIVGWCKEVGIKSIVILASCNAYERWDYNQITGSQLRYLTSASTDSEALKSLGTSELEEREDEFGQKHRFLSGAGFVKQFMEICDLPVTTLFKFVDEGDNTQDAIVLASYFNSWKKVVQEKDQPWKMPFSWRNMFGGPAPTSIY